MNSFNDEKIKSSQMKFIWFRDIPTWVAAFGTALIAFIAIITLGPIIENLELREKNIELRDSNRNLKQLINENKSIELQLYKELNDL